MTTRSPIRAWAITLRFDDVQVVTAERIDIETTTYVRNIFKYYVFYRLSLGAQAAATKLKENVAPATK